MSTNIVARLTSATALIVQSSVLSAAVYDEWARPDPESFSGGGIPVDDIFYLILIGAGIILWFGSVIESKVKQWPFLVFAFGIGGYLLYSASNWFAMLIGFIFMALGGLAIVWRRSSPSQDG